MTTTITVQDGTGASTTPTMVLFPIESADEGRNLVHRTLDGAIAVSVYPLDPRSGELTLLYLDEATARTARELHRRAAPFKLVDTLHAARSMTYITRPDGTKLIYDEDTRKRWKLVVGYQEIIP